MCALAHTDPGSSGSREFEALEAELGPLEGDPVPLEGGITNRNFRAVFSGREVVVRVPGRDTSELGIDRTAEADAAQAAARLGIGPPVAAAIEEPRCIAVDFVPGETMTAEMLQGNTEIALVAAILRKMHESKAIIPTEFDVFAVVEDHAERSEKRGAVLPAEYELAFQMARQIKEKFGGPMHRPVFTHNDLLPANLIRSDDGALHLLDWDYSGMGDRFFDLANFAINAELSDSGREHLLESYFGEASDANRAAMTLMLVMSDFREAMWGVLQGVLSDLDFDFGAYASKHFQRLLETSRTEDFEAALEAEVVA